MTSSASSFRLDALHVFQVRTLGSLGFSTRVALSNKSHNKGQYATDYRVDVTVHSASGQLLTHQKGIAELAVGSIVRIDCAKWQAAQADQVMIFHLMPRRLLPVRRDDGTVEVARDEIWSLFTAQDHYVEYYRDDGFSTGVLYQSGAFNYEKFSREETTVIQAPKIYVSRTVDTLLSVLHTSFETDYTRIACLRYALLDKDGAVAVRGVLEIQPFTCRTLSFRGVLQAAGIVPGEATPSFYTLVALCDNAALLPLVMNHNAAHGNLAVEHSLPPLYYGQSVTGAMRAEMVHNLRNSNLFKTHHE